MSKQRWSPFFLLISCLTLGVGCEDFEDSLGADGGDENHRASGDVCSSGNSANGDCIPYEAEKRSSQSGTKVATNHAGFTGTGFVDFGGNGTWIEWNAIAAPVAGQYTLTFRYANGSAGNRQTEVLVNGEKAGNVPFGKTGSWKKWSRATFQVGLVKGNNSIRIKANTGSP